jgi:hypothetical protein
MSIQRLHYFNEECIKQKKIRTLKPSLFCYVTWCRLVQTLPISHSKYVLDGPAHAEFCASQKLVCMYMYVCVCVCVVNHTCTYKAVQLKSKLQTILLPALSPSSIFPPPSYHCPFIPTRKSLPYISKTLSHLLQKHYLISFTFLKLCTLGSACS